MYAPLGQVEASNADTLNALARELAQNPDVSQGIAELIRSAGQPSGAPTPLSTFLTTTLAQSNVQTAVRQTATTAATDWLAAHKGAVLVGAAVVGAVAFGLFRARR